MNNVQQIASHFQIYGDLQRVEPYGSGHINDTYAAYYNQGGTDIRFIFQRINHNIFTNPEALMENIARVTRHITSKLSANKASEISRKVLTVIPTKDNQDYYKDDAGNYWRAYIFIEKAQTFDILDTPKQAFEAAKAFGEFQKILVDIPGEPLHETIPNFHNGPMRYQTFLQALEADVHNRADSAKEEINFLKEHAWILDVLPEQIAKGNIPMRITHNDCKINNVMLDNKTGSGICVIDLDTVMPGSALYDFGDMIRTSTNTGAEDEKDLSKISMDMKMFKAVAEGYLSTANEFLNKHEKEYLVHSGKMITLIIGTRFITDYLLGDQYFKVHHPTHNLERCRTQFKLVRSIIEQEEEMKEFIASL